MTRTAAALSAAVLLAFCFPSGGLWPLAWIALVPLILSIEKDPLGIAFGRGYLAGLLFFILTLFWIHHVTWVGLILMAVYLALYWGAFAMAAAYSSAWPLWRRALFLASLWAGLEYIRAHAFTGFGWAGLAHTQVFNALVIQIADITGTYGISWMMAAAAVVLAAFAKCMIRREKPAPDMWRTAMGVVLIAVVMMAYGAWRLAPPDEARSRVALIQGNVSLADHWDPLLRPFTVGKYLQLSREAMAHAPELIIWPETAFPSFAWEHPELFEQVRAFARDNKVRVLLGLVTRANDQYFNSALMIDEQGRTAGQYDKQHLVLLGEYIPLRRQLPFLARFVPIDDFTPGRGNTLFRVPGAGPFSALICFEDTIPELARQAVHGGAGFLVNMTNDAWFGVSRQRRMHLDNAAFRAVENRRTLVRATNTGISCGVTPRGSIGPCVDDSGAGFVMVDIPTAGAGLTFYTKYGDVFAMLCFLGILGLSFIRRP